MLETATIARPYARALFALARDAGALSEYSEQLRLLAALVEDEQLHGLLGHPRIDRRALADAIIDAAGGVFDKTMQNYIRVLAENGRLPVVPVIAAQFNRLRAETENRLRVQVHSARPLSEDQQRGLRASLARRFGSEIDIDTQIDESLLAGVVIRAGDQVIDASARGRLARLGQVMQRPR